MAIISIGTAPRLQRKLLQEQDGSEATAAVGTALAELATAAKAEQVLLTKLSDDKPITNELVRQVPYFFTSHFSVGILCSLQS